MTDFIALELYETHCRLEPAPVRRPWMEESWERFAYRCLPLLIANSSAWHVIPGITTEVTWDGGKGADALTVRHLDGADFAVSMFGDGIVTFHVPYLIRTPPGWNTLVRGPVNWPRDGVAPLEGIVETDWTTATFTMNWKLTRPGTVEFAAGDPVCALVPQPRGQLEQLEPRRISVDGDAQARRSYETWAQGRAEQVREIAASGRMIFDGSYARGTSLTGDQAPPDHQRRVRLRSFA